MVIARLADATNVTALIALLFDEFGSGVELDTDATSLTVVGSAAVTTTVTVVRPPAGSVPRLQTMLAAFVSSIGVGVHVPDGLAVAADDRERGRGR